jgi:ABC-type transporter Mla subunit MlaD
MEERFEFRHVHAITGTFVLVVVAVLIAAVVWTGRSQRWFRSNVTLRIALPEAAQRHPEARRFILGNTRGSV